MALSKEELLRPRFKVVADYPGNEWAIGIVLEKMKNTAAWLSPCNNINIGMRIEAAEKYPHLFRKLEWHEDREESDMPEYVSLNPENTIGEDMVIKVVATRKTEDGVEICFGNPNEDGPFENFTHCRYYLPATEEEYNQYIQKQTTNG